MPPRLRPALPFRRSAILAPQISSRACLLIRPYKTVGNRQRAPARETAISSRESGSSLSPPPNTEKGTTTWGNLDLLGGLAAPVFGIESAFDDGFAFSSGVKVEDGSGVFLWQNQCFKWRPAEKGSEVEARALKTGVLELEDDVWGMLDVLYPKPGKLTMRPDVCSFLTSYTELLILGTGARGLMVSQKDRERLTDLGVQMEAMDTNNASTYYNLLAQERPGQVAAALLVLGFGKTE